VINKKKIILQQMKASKYLKADKAFDKAHPPMGEMEKEDMRWRRCKRKIEFEHTFIDREFDNGEITMEEWMDKCIKVRNEIMKEWGYIL
jgi:hypothetical protein